MTAETFTVTIDSLSYGGRGVGRRQDGKVAFVSFVIPGETVLARVEEEHASYCTASVLEILERSPERVEPECPLFTRCGGCDWQHMKYHTQLQWKNAILTREVARSARLQDLTTDPPAPSESIYQYRAHAVLQVRGPELGFHMKKTNSVIGIDQCPVLNPRLQGLIPELARILGETQEVPILSLELHAPGDETILEARCGHIGKKACLRLMERMHKELGISGVSFVLSEGRLALGKESCSYPLVVDGRMVEISSSFGEFIQANTCVNQVLVNHVVHLARGSGRIIDLYSGSGNFSIPLALGAGEVLAVEWSRGLVSQGRESAEKNKAGNVSFLAMDVLKAIKEMTRGHKRADTVVLDPPREGAKGVASLLPGLGASRIIYISCNPTTLARDLKPIIQAGYSLKSLKLFDMFPQTFHIECVACLER
jgi:23S rRNA (uracil1939-C5)-methyltransferase